MKTKNIQQVMKNTKSIIKLFWLFLLFSVIGTMIGTIITTPIANSELKNILTIFIGNFISTIVLLIFCYKNKVKSAPNFPPFDKPQIEMISSFEFVFGTLGVVGSGLVISNIIGLIQKASGDTTANTDIVLSTKLPILIIQFLVICIFVPIVEEYFYRWYVYKNLKNVNNTCAEIAVSLIFALMHNSVNAVISMFIFSLLACYINDEYNSPLPSIIAHILFNIVNFAQLYILVNVPNYIYIIYFIILFTSVAFLCVLIRRIKQPINKIQKFDVLTLVKSSLVPFIMILIFTHIFMFMKN